MAKVMVFIDGTWLYSNLRTLGEDFQVDYGKLPHVVGNQIAKKLGDKSVDIVRIFMFGSNATNFLDADKDMVKRRRIFYDVLREEYNYEVEVYLVDYRGRRLKRKDRHPDDDFSPEEKCVDIALASSMLYFAALPLAYDIAIVIGGDRDYVPVLQKVRLLGKRTAIASIHGACSFELSEGKNLKGVRDFDVIWLNDLLDEIRMTNEIREVMCKAPFHVGPNPIKTDEFVRKNRAFYCKDCREKMWHQRGEFDEDEEDLKYAETPGFVENNRYREAGQPIGDSRNGLRTGDCYTGVVKRLMEFCGFIGTDAGDFYFGMDDCVGGTEFSKLRSGDRVEFIVSRAPRKEYRGRDGNGNAEEVSLVTQN
jgi:cold shock CspA family protein